jgi:hypothetical protein
MSDILFRCSSIGKMMGDPMSIAAEFRTPEVEAIIASKKRTDDEKALIAKLKAASLSDTAKSHIRQMAAEAIFGVDFTVRSREMDKGTQCEEHGIALYNSVFGKSLVKNTERRRDEYLCGEADMPDVEEVVDIKLAWSVATFPLSEDDIAETQRNMYEWQLRAYMRLWDKPRGRIAYCLVDTPEDLCKWEDPRLHMVGHIPEHMRVTTWAYERDPSLEAMMIDKIKRAREYYSRVVRQFHETHILCTESFT